MSSLYNLYHIYFEELNLLKLPTVTISKISSNSSTIFIKTSNLVLKVFSKKVSAAFFPILTANTKGFFPPQYLLLYGYRKNKYFEKTIKFIIHQRQDYQTKTSRFLPNLMLHE